MSRAEAVKRISLSNIIRQANGGAAISIGERHHDADLELRAAELMSRLLPLVSFFTDHSGAKLIPITEIFKIKEAIVQARKQAEEQGYKRGLEAGKNDGLKDARKVVNDLDRAVADAIGQREAMLNEAREKILGMVMQISRKVTYDAVRVDPESCLQMIDGVIDSLVDRSKLVIKVHPDHLPIVEQHINRFLESSTTIKELSFAADPRVHFGGCFVETPTGDIDARLESQLDVIEDAIVSEEEEQ